MTVWAVIPILYESVYANAFHPAYYIDASSSEKTPVILRTIQLPVLQPRSWAGLLREWMLSAAYEERLRRRAAQPNRIFVRSLFVDLVDRLPAAEEADRMRNALDGLADAGPLRSVLARLMIDSGQVPLPEKKDIEDPTAWVAGLFERLLGRRADEDELRVFVETFHDPDCLPSTVLYALVSHPEYQTW